jgi:hypothetical protein
MSAKLDFKALNRSRSAAIFQRTLESIDFEDLGLSKLVRLKAIYSQLIEKDDIKNIPDGVFKSYIHMLPNRSIRLNKLVADTQNCSHVTILFPNIASGPHLKAISNFTAFLISMPSINRVDIVFSAELSPDIWRNKVRKSAQKLKIGKALKSAMAAFHNRRTPQKLLKKLHVTLAPEEPELAATIGDVVIRYEGSVPNGQFRLCSNSIFRQRPVMAIVGTSIISRVPDIDLLLTPANRDYREGEVHYLRPLPSFLLDQKKINSKFPAGSTKTIVTGYCGDKLERGLRELDKLDWHAMARLFRQFPEIRWHLFGAQDIAAVRAAIPPKIIREFSGRITLSGFIKLDHFFHGIFAFLALPGVGGSGTTAKLALSASVPVLVCRNGDRDISNMFPKPAPLIKFEELLEVLCDWATDSSMRAQFLESQLKDINQRADLQAKFSEMEKLLARTKTLFLQRQNENLERQDAV